MARPFTLVAALVLLSVSLIASVPVSAQTSKPAPPGSIAAHPDWPKANPTDVSSVDAILASLYDVISGPPGQRDWNRFRSLFVPEGRLTSTVTLIMGLLLLLGACGKSGQFPLQVNRDGVSRAIQDSSMGLRISATETSAESEQSTFAHSKRAKS